ncbi:MAG: hypothetical protein GOV15_00290 [Candidatus Diapherotrites archaeon]|nr:hypothetical protein [Candidatus Diapherotrites archaeon]
MHLMDNKAILAAVAVLLVVVVAGFVMYQPAADDAMANDGDAMVDDHSGDVDVIGVSVPSVSVSGQAAVSGKVTIANVVSVGDGWLVIHADAAGSPGAVIGYTAVGDGENSDVVVRINEGSATDTLYAMLHVDDGSIGEFDSSDDAVVEHKGSVVVSSFAVTGLRVFIEPGMEGNAPVTPPQATVKEFDVTAKQFEFVPSTITVTKGDTVRLNVTSVDVPHGVFISEFGVNQDLAVNETATVEFIADQAGSFTMHCSVFCGAGHGGMKGTLIVEDV